MAACECYIARLEMDDHLQALNIEERRVTIEPTEDLEEISVDGNCPNRITRISTQAKPLIRKELALFLKNNQNAFAWSHEDMSRINPSVMVHKLNGSSSLSFLLVQQKKRLCPRKRQSHRGRSSQATGSKFHQRGILSRLVGQRSDSEKGKCQVKDVCRLH